MSTAVSYLGSHPIVVLKECHFDAPGVGVTADVDQHFPQHAQHCHIHPIRELRWEAVAHRELFLALRRQLAVELHHSRRAQGADRRARAILGNLTQILPQDVPFRCY